MRVVVVRAARRAHRRLRGRQRFVGAAERVAHQAIRVGVRARLLAQRVATLDGQMWVLGSRVWGWRGTGKGGAAQPEHGAVRTGIRAGLPSTPPLPAILEKHSCNEFYGIA